MIGYCHGTALSSIKLVQPEFAHRSIMEQEQVTVGPSHHAN